MKLSDALECCVAGLKLTTAAGWSALVVEDHVLIALDLETLLLELGASNVMIANSVDQALKLVSGMTFDAALLDVQLGDTTSIPIATALRELGVPFAVATGYHTSSTIPAEFLGCPLITKPYRIEEVRSVLRELLSLAGETGAGPSGSER